MRNLLIGLALAIGLTACATAPKSPAQAVYAAHGTYLGAITLAVKYRQLPPCEASVSKVCADKVVVGKLRQADDVAFAALTAAQNVVRIDPESPGAQRAVQTATAAVTAFASIVNALEVQR